MRFLGVHGTPDRPWEFGPAGGTRYVCPFACGWHHDELQITRWRIPLGSDISDAINEGARMRMADTEAAVTEHLKEHTARVMLSPDEPTST